MVAQLAQPPNHDFWRKLILPEEDRRNQRCPPPWTGSYRWFRSPNIVDLWNYRSAAEKERIGKFMRWRQLPHVFEYRP